MKKSDTLLFLLALTLLLLAASVGQGSTPLQESESLTRSRQLTVLAGEVDINNADAEELCTLPGIGPVLAGRIIERRETVGPFECLEELQTVSGIGEKTVDKILEYTED